MGYVDQLRHYDLDPEVRLIVDAQYAKGLVKIDPSAAMLSLRAVIADASTSGQHRVASWATTTLVNVLCTNGDLTEALELTKIRAEWDRGADIGPWSKAANEVQHLQVLGEMNRHSEVHELGTALIDRLATIAPTAEAGEHVIPWSVLEHLFGIVSTSAVAMEDWPLADELVRNVLNSMESRQAPEHEIMRAYFKAHVPLLHLEEYTKADQVLQACQDTALSIGDFEMLGVIHGTRATIADKRGQAEEALRFVKTALRYNYQSKVIGNLITCHLQFADFLSRDGHHQEAIDHRLTAAVLCRVSGRTERYADTVGRVTEYLRTEGRHGVPADIDELADRVEAISGIRFRDTLTGVTLDSASIYLDIIDEAQAKGRSAREDIWPTSTFQSERTRVEVKVGPRFYPEKRLWRVVCRIVNIGERTLHVDRVHIEGFEGTTRSTWRAHLLPYPGEDWPAVIDAGTDAQFRIDGDELVSSIWDIGDCDCVVTTSSGENLIHPLRGETGDKFKLMCLTDSVRLTHGSVEKVTFPWTGPPEELLTIIDTQETQWKLNFMLAKGFVTKSTGPDGQDRYFASDRGREFLQQGAPFGT